MRLGTSERRLIPDTALRGGGLFRRDLGYMGSGQHHAVRDDDATAPTATALCGATVWVWPRDYPAAGSATRELRCNTCQDATGI